MNLPFAVSPEAERYLRKHLARRPPSGMEPSLTRALRSHVRDKAGELVERFDHEHYFFGYSPPSKHIRFSRLEVDGRSFAISPETLAILNGKRLSIRQLPRLDDPSRSREILVAADIDEATSKA